MQGFYFEHVVSSEDGFFELKSLDMSRKITCLNDSENIEYCEIQKITEFKSDCVSIEFEDGNEFICTFFVNLFDVNKQNFVKAHSLIRGDIILSTSGNLVVKQLRHLRGKPMINLQFVGLPSFYINSIFCHSNEQPSAYAVYKRDLMAQKSFLIDNLHRVINPNVDRNKNINILWKSEKFNKLRKAFYLADGDFGKKSSGYSFGYQNSLEIQITKYSFISKKIIFYGQGSNVKCKNFNNCSVKIYENYGSFLVLVENFQDESLAFEFSSQEECTLTNCLFISSHEIEHINRIFSN